MNKIEVANDVLSRQLSWISAADSKISSIFAINGAMLGVLAALISPIEKWTIFCAIMAAFSAVPLFGSMISLALAIFPRLSGPKGSLIYFGEIVSRSEDSYVQEVYNMDDNLFKEDMLRQVYRNAEIAQTKFNCVKWAMIQTFTGFLPWLVAIWCLYKQ